ncbi:MAG TPA: Spy/CpxP family protein refolding chaperone [Vicinamibacterales bacterium]
MRRFYGHTILAVGMVVGLVAVAAAQPPAGGAGMRGRGMGPGMRQGMGPGGGPMAALKLTAVQRDAIQKLQEQHRAANEGKADQMRGLREGLRAAIFAGDEQAAMAKAHEIAAFEADLLPSRVALQIEIVKQLTPDQKKIAMELGLFGPEGMGPATMGPGGIRGRRGGQPPIKK